jgi:myo-inositol-1(or 4)-monophosphatase
MLEFERAAQAAALRAGALLRSRYHERQVVDRKSSTVDLVTAVDRAAEAEILGILTHRFPAHGIVAEESAVRAGEGRYRWYVDPLDGTTNFAHGFPHFAVSIALADGDDVVLGLVHDPVRRETFSAVRGRGATLNGARIRVSTTPVLGDALLATGFPADRRERAWAYTPFHQAALERARCVRRAGSAALDLCYVASGRLDGFWEWKLHPWDTAAGVLVVHEAGGRVTDAGGGPHVLAGDETVASNGLIHHELIEMLAHARSTAVAVGAG